MITFLLFWLEPGLGIRSFTHLLFVNLLKVAHFKEQQGVICSCHYLKKTDQEQIALVALRKRATGSEWLLVLFKKERS